MFPAIGTLKQTFGALSVQGNGFSRVVRVESECRVLMKEDVVQTRGNNALLSLFSPSVFLSLVHTQVQETSKGIKMLEKCPG